MELQTPRLVVAGLAGDSGKTLVSLGLCRAASDLGLEVQAFKKGPDYIDAAWLGAASGRPCRNLDTFLMTPETIVRSAAAAAAAADVAVVEGNRGLYDGVDARGAHSTAELAKLLDAPVVLVVNVTKATRTVAALVLGCRQLDPEVRLAGVVLNSVATDRQEAVIREAIEGDTGVPVLGAVRRLRGNDPLPGRHLGLVTVAEHPSQELALKRAAVAVRDGVELERLLTVARAASTLPAAAEVAAAVGPATATVGYLHDPAFSFYYPENLEALEASGARLVPVATEGELPVLDALYIGGGFPEAHAPRLAGAHAFLASLRQHAQAGLPVYAECGGLMLLAQELVVDDAAYPMAGVLDVCVEHTSRPEGHGYVVGRVDGANPYFASGTELRGHEFHYSKVVGGSDMGRCVVQLERGVGVGAKRDGIVRGRVWASYLHLHALGCREWADGIVGQAVEYRAMRTTDSVAAWG
jgi:cobyrinic acid a,c-diamide synthase